MFTLKFILCILNILNKYMKRTVLILTNMYTIPTCSASGKLTVRWGYYNHARRQVANLFNIVILCIIKLSNNSYYRWWHKYTDSMQCNIYHNINVSLVYANRATVHEVAFFFNKDLHTRLTVCWHLVIIK